MTWRPAMTAMGLTSCTWTAVLEGPVVESPSAVELSVPEENPIEAPDSELSGYCVQGAAYIGSSPFDSLVEAIEAAQDNDVVDVCPGDHFGPFPVVDLLTLTLRNVSGGAVPARLYADDERSILSFAGNPYIRLSGLTFEDASLDWPIVSAAEVNWLEIDNCWFENNDAQAVRTVQADDDALADSSVVWISRSVFRHNHTVFTGGAVSVYGAGSVEISDSVFDSNHSDGNGGAVMITGSPSNVMLFDNVFAENSAGLDGGALHVHVEEAVPIRVSGAEIWGNTARYGAAMHLSALDQTLVNASLTNAVIRANVASENGSGGIHSRSWRMELENVDLGEGTLSNFPRDLAGCETDYGDVDSLLYEGFGEFCP